MAKLFVIGTGPGDSKLITLKALEIIKSCNLIFAPFSNGKSTALSIIKEYINQNTKIVHIDFPMTRNINTLKENWKKAADAITNRLNNGITAAFITLGDPCFYSTFAYIYNDILNAGIDVEIIPGITSFSAGASSAGITICENTSKTIIVPALENSDSLEYYIDNFETVILMKSSKILDDIKNIIKKKNLYDNTIIFSNIGFENEIIVKGKEIDLIENIGYFTTAIIKK